MYRSTIYYRQPENASELTTSNKNFQESNTYELQGQS